MRRMIGSALVFGLAVLLLSAQPASAHRVHIGIGFGFWAPPVVVGPPPVVYVSPPPVYYAPPAAYYYYDPPRYWVPGHWERRWTRYGWRYEWVPGYWRYRY